MQIKLIYLILSVMVFFVGTCNNALPNSAPLPSPSPQIVVDTPTAPTLESCQQLTVSGADGWYPLFMTNQENNQVYGLSVDLIRKIATDLNLSLTIKNNIPWKRQLIMLQEGTLDIMLGAYWTQERSKIYIYTEPFMQDEVNVFVLKGNEFPLTDLADLQGKIGTVPSGGSYGEAFDRYAQEHLTLDQAENKVANFQKLVAGYSDYAIFAYWDGTAYLIENGLTEQIIALPYAITVNDVHLMVSPRSPCATLIEQINQRIVAYQQDGTLVELLEKYR